jgi:Zn-dependent M16 (insulinase) family peptidase
MSFQKLRSRKIAAMQAEVQEYEDPATGARHIHLASNDLEFVFLVGFPTVPDASDGRAHILEHLALCGSQRFPVRDPFFAMSRRSTAHFMNAMTYADKTVYPFASTDKTDFFNLLNVYLDAVFFPRLDYLDFLQEGWRLNLDGERLSYQGIVFNEMKGAFADPVRALDAGISKHLLAGTTYEVESGGDPLDIPSLTYEELKTFHATHYHPSQAVFMTAGSIDPLEIQQVIVQTVLPKISGRLPRLLPQLAVDWPSPRSTEVSVPTREHGVQIAWLLGETVTLEQYYEAILLDAGLLGNSAAPIAHAMESAGYGRPSAMNGADTGMRQIVFHLGMEGLRKDQVADARDRIWNALKQAAEEGVPKAVLEAALRDFRFRQREIAAGSMPNAMRRLLRAMPHQMYGGDIMNGFDSEDVLKQMQQKIADPGYFKALARKLIDANTRLDITVVPDPAYFDQRNKTEEERLQALHASLTTTDKDRLCRDAAELLERQRRPVNNDMLPRIRPRDVNPLPRPAKVLPQPAAGTVEVPIASNGICYARVLYDLSDLDSAQWPWLQLYAELVPELGAGTKSYHEADAWRHDKVPFFDINVHVMQKQDETAALRIHVDFYVKGLCEENGALAEVLTESVRAPRFDEYERIAFLIDSTMQDMRDELAENGDDYAKLAATSSLSPLRRYEEKVRGSSYLSFFRDLHMQCQHDEGRREIGRRLAELHQRIVGANRTLLTAGGAQDARALAELIDIPEPTRDSIACKDIAAAVPDPSPDVALHAPAQVNHCYVAWRAPAVSDPDAPVLAVLGELLTNLVLHQSLREEGGAYGGQAAYSTDSNLFLMMSYRDPRLAATYETFDRAVNWVMDADIAQEHLEEAIICVIQSLDKPRTPYEEVIWAWEQQQRGVTEEIRASYRHRVLNCTIQQVKDAAVRWLLDKPRSRAAFVGNPDQDLAGLQLVALAELAE